jgi:hypothetical protein
MPLHKQPSDTVLVPVPAALRPPGASHQGLCAADADCPAGLKCELPYISALLTNDTTSQQCWCQDGMDVCKPVGRCGLHPAEVACQECNQCLQAAAAFTTTHQALPATQLLSSFTAWCNSTTNDATACAQVVLLLANSTNANLGRRAAALCAVTGACPAELLGPVLPGTFLS